MKINRGINRNRGPECLNVAGFFFFVASEKEAERIRERLAQEEAEAMEMEDEESKAEHMLEKGVSKEKDHVVECLKMYFQHFLPQI